MVRKALPVVVGAVVVAFLPQAGRAQAVPATPYYAIDPHAPLTPSANSPVQQQILQNYRSQLMQSQQQLLQQNSSGSSISQMELNRQLNQFNAVPAPPIGAAPLTAPPTPYNPAIGR